MRSISVIAVIVLVQVTIAQDPSRLLTRGKTWEHAGCCARRRFLRYSEVAGIHIRRYQEGGFKVISLPGMT
jgi:hypothetical protein